jgi:hypothetical protein
MLTTEVMVTKIDEDEPKSKVEGAVRERPGPAATKGFLR